MSLAYKYGEEVPYIFEVLKPEDREKLQAFSCENAVLDKYIREEVIQLEGGEWVVKCLDGLHFKVENKDTHEIIGFVSLASSGIIYQVDNYTHVLPAIKIDVFAIDLKYQKMHYDKNSAMSSDPDEHYYFSDDVMGSTLCHIREINEKYALVDYIALYAEKKKVRFYKRNGFVDFSEYMVKENNQEINKNIPMYLAL